MSRRTLTARIAAGLSRGLLLAMPRAFRRELGDAVTCALEEQATAALAHGWSAYVRCLGRGARDLLCTAGELWLGQGRTGLALRPAQARRVLRAGARAWIAGVVERLAFDVRAAARALRRSPGYSGASLLTLTLAIGASTAIFGLVHAVLLSPLPFRGGERMVAFRHEVDGVGGRSVGFSVQEIDRLRRELPALESVVEFHTMSFTLVGGARPEVVSTGVVSWEYFEFLGVDALHGRLIEAHDEATGRPPILVMSHEYWRRSHGADPGVVGRELVLDDRLYRVIGVLPPVPQYPRSHDIYVPVSACSIRSDPEFIGDPTRRMMGAVARMGPGAGVERVRRELEREWQGARPDTTSAQGEPLAVRVLELREELTRGARPLLTALLLSTVLVLVCACANVVNLTLARVLAGRRETALRAALGAGRGRLLRQRALECLLLSGGGAALGLVVATRGSGALVTLVSRYTTRPVEVALDLPVLAFAALLALVSGLTAGLVPSLSATEPSRALREGGAMTAGRGAATLRGLLIGVQVAASVALLVAATLSFRTVVNLGSIDLGFETRDVQAVFAHFGASRYPTVAEAQAFLDAAASELEAAPEVAAAAVAAEIPLLGTVLRHPFRIAGRPDSGRAATSTVEPVGPGYFDVLGIPLVQGRPIRAEEHARGAPVALISRALAERHWPDSSPLGARLRYEEGDVEVEVVGVVGDVRRQGGYGGPEPETYVPARLLGFADSILVRGAPGRSAEDLTAAIRGTIARLDPRMAVRGPFDLAGARSETTETPRVMSTLLALFALLSIAIAATGISGLIACLVGQRTREIGVRMALGAGAARVLRATIGDGLRPVLAGLATGLALAAAVCGLLDGMLFGVGPRDPLTYGAAALITLLVGAVACWAPARRALAVRPAVALRAD